MILLSTSVNVIVGMHLWNGFYLTSWLVCDEL